MAGYDSFQEIDQIAGKPSTMLRGLLLKTGGMSSPGCSGFYACFSSCNTKPHLPIGD